MIVVVGLSHKTAPVDVRERLATSSDVQPLLLERLRHREELGEVVFLSTCNRVEVFATAVSSGEEAIAAVREVLAGFAQAETTDALLASLYDKAGDEAVRHVFRVAASLDSMVLGEPQILGQVKAAHDAAVAAGTVGPYLGRCITRAFTVAKRVRSETSLGEGTVSISSVAVDLAKRIFGDLNDQIVLLVGAGEMAEAAAKSLGRSAKAIRVCNRSFERGAALAQTIGADVARWEHLEQELVVADVVVASTASPQYVITRDLMKRVVKARRGRTLFLIDIAVPRNVEPAVHTFDNVYVYNVDDLQQQVAEGLKSRHGAVTEAETIVSHELAEFVAWTKGLEVQPTIVALRSKIQATLLGELEKAFSGRLKHLSEADRETLTRIMESAANKVSHAPTTQLKVNPSDARGLDLVHAARVLFDLSEEELAAEAQRIQGRMRSGPPPRNMSPSAPPHASSQVPPPAAPSGVSLVPPLPAPVDLATAAHRGEGARGKG